MQSLRASDLVSNTRLYSTTIFTKDEVNEIDIFEKNNKLYLNCIISKKDKLAKPEEIVRQIFIKRLNKKYGYPLERIVIERKVWFGSGIHEKRADIVVLHKDLENPYIIVEVKKPKRKDGLQQLKSYCNAEGSPIGVWTNGEEIVVLHREEPNIFSNISDIPTFNQTLYDLIKDPWTIEKLEENNKLVIEKVSLKDIILDLENLVLANAGVDSFEEVFKLIYAKLYDEWASKNVKRRNNRISFRIYGESPQELYVKISDLFNKANRKWKGVFNPLEKIELIPSHLYTCVSFLQDIKLFNSNLQIIDDAFEYLVTQVAKGSKGQYFTPRHVIDMCIKMLNPKENEYLIDPAAGSCGFTIHTILWIFGESSLNLPTLEKIEYASSMIYGIDFDDRAVKTAKALNLIAGDGKQNVLKLNSLDPKSWTVEGKSKLNPFLTRFPEDPDKDAYNQENYKYFDFDLVMTNPPFAGDIRDRQLLRNFDLAPNRLRGVSRDVLFIERCLNFLKEGGRLAIVLPQGRLSNVKDDYIRRYISKHARILGSISLDENTFKPHAGTRTSVLLLQKWDDEFCKQVDDYPIFFSVSECSGKNSRGDYIYLLDKKKERFIDKHGHFLIKHDLDEIANEFINFAKKENFSFWRE